MASVVHGLLSIAHYYNCSVLLLVTINLVPILSIIGMLVRCLCGVCVCVCRGKEIAHIWCGTLFVLTTPQETAFSFSVFL